jgi:hypothetical protein
MSANVTSTNPIVQAIVTGKAPQAARMAAARGLLPLPQVDLLEALVALRQSEEPEISRAAEATLEAQEADALLSVVKEAEAPPAVLGYLAGRAGTAREIQEAVALNAATPDQAIALMASQTTDGTLLELISINQQRLIRTPAIIDAILGNAARTAEAERRVTETRREFFEKERGAQQVAEELRARGRNAAAEFLETAESLSSASGFTIEDAWLIAEHIEVADSDIDDSWLALERLEEISEESYDLRLANAERVINETMMESGDVPPERVALIRRIMLMSVRDRIKLAMKGDREVRSILIRDANKVVSTGVINNPRITENEVENIAAMRMVSDDVLRLISLNRAWARSYPIIHNLARNPRTPIPTAVGILPRIRGKDLDQLAKNRNVSEAVRRQANRISRMRSGN